MFGAFSAIVSKLIIYVILPPDEYKYFERFGQKFKYSPKGSAT